GRVHRHHTAVGWVANNFNVPNASARSHKKTNRASGRRQSPGSSTYRGTDVPRSPQFVQVLPVALTQEQAEEQFADLTRVAVHLGEEVRAGGVVRGHVIAQRAGKLLDLFGGLRQFVERAIVDNTEPTLHP